MDTTLGLGSGKVNNRSLSSAAAGVEQGEGGGHNEMSKESARRFGDAPPVFVMPDGYSYMHVKRNGLIFGCATEKNVSPVAVIEVRIYCAILVHSLSVATTCACANIREICLHIPPQ